MRRQGLPIVQGETTWPGDVHAGPEEGGYNLPLHDGLFDDGVDFVLSNATVPDRLARWSADLKRMM